MAFKSLKDKTQGVKFSDFLNLLKSLNVKKSLFALGLFLSLVTSVANLVLPLLTRE